MDVIRKLYAFTVLLPGKKTGAYWIGGWVGPTEGLDVLEKRKISSSYRDSNSGTPSPKLSHYTDFTWHSVIVCLLTRTKHVKHSRYKRKHKVTPFSIKQLKVCCGNKLSAQLVKKFPAFYGTKSFITAFKSAVPPSLSSANSIQSIPHIPLLKDPS
jgi:hypothetical protein